MPDLIERLRANGDWHLGNEAADEIERLTRDNARYIEQLEAFRDSDEKLRTENERLRAQHEEAVARLAAMSNEIERLRAALQKICTAGTELVDGDIVRMHESAVIAADALHAHEALK